MDELTKIERRTLESVARMNLKLRKIIAYVFIIIAWLAILKKIIIRKGNLSLWPLVLIFFVTAFVLNNL